MEGRITIHNRHENRLGSIYKMVTSQTKDIDRGTQVAKEHGKSEKKLQWHIESKYEYSILENLYRQEKKKTMDQCKKGNNKRTHRTLSNYLQ